MSKNKNVNTGENPSTTNTFRQRSSITHQHDEMKDKADDAHTTLITLIHIGDIHGHLLPRPHLRSDGTGSLQGGLARLYQKISEIRDQNRFSLLINTGDTIQGSAEALYTRGQALVDVMNEFAVDYFAPGNWDYVYGVGRFQELFTGDNPVAPWNALAANLYFDDDCNQPVNRRVLPAYDIREINGVKIGILGFTSERGPKAVGADVVKGYRFSKGDSEMRELVPGLRSQVDVLVMISELGLANNIRLADKTPGVDIILSSDMHEETREPVITQSGTLIVEEGQDGTRLGELQLLISNNQLKETRFTMHVIDDSINEHPRIAAKITEIRKPFVTGTFTTHRNPINGTLLTTPIDTIVGITDVPLHRSNFSNEPMPAVIEGSSHNFLADTFREMTQSDTAVIRGFRYGTHVAPGPIRLEDIYHYVPVGPFIAKGEVSGEQIKNTIENSAEGSLSTDLTKWKGGWLHGWAGLRYNLDIYAAKGKRASHIDIQRYATNKWERLNPDSTYMLSGYNYASEPDLINKIPVKNICCYKDGEGQCVDATQVVVDYLKSHNANPDNQRVNLLRPLPAQQYKNRELQPLKGARDLADDSQT